MNNFGFTKCYYTDHWYKTEDRHCHLEITDKDGYQWCYRYIDPETKEVLDQFTTGYNVDNLYHWLDDEGDIIKVINEIEHKPVDWGMVVTKRKELLGDWYTDDSGWFFKKDHVDDKTDKVAVAYKWRNTKWKSDYWTYDDYINYTKGERKYENWKGL